MKFIQYSHRHADAIIECEEALKNRYEQFIGALESISEEELIEDFVRRKVGHTSRGTAFKSMTSSINSILKERLLEIPGWQAEVDIFNDTTGAIGNTEWRLDFACDDAFCVEVAFNHGEAIAWNLLKPVLSCELNHVQKAIQGKIGIYVCATDKMKVSANIDNSSGSYEKVLRYLPPMMNQLTIPMMIIGLEPFETFKVSENAEIVKCDFTIDDSILNHKVLVTENESFDTYKGVVVDINICENGEEPEKRITVRRYKKQSKEFSERMIRFLEVLD